VEARVARFVLVQRTKTGGNIPNDQKMYQMDMKYVFQMTPKYTNWPQNISSGHKIKQYFQFQDPLKYTQIGILGMKQYPSGNPGGGGLNV
jgi:hypothetical protein